jgi:hypothetical protein
VGAVVTGKAQTVADEDEFQVVQTGEAALVDRAANPHQGLALQRPPVITTLLSRFAATNRARCAP